MSLLARNPRTVDPSHGGRGTLPPLPRGGGGGGGRGDSNQPDYTWKLRRYRMGLFFFLVTVTILFVTMTAAFLMLKSGNKYNPYTNRYDSEWEPIAIPRQLLLFNTLLLLVSSITLERARRKSRVEAVIVPASRIPGIIPIREDSRHWVFATVGLGFAFLAGQWRAWEWLRAKDLFTRSGAASSFVFLLTGAHAVHLLGGLLVLLYASFVPGRKDAIYRRSITIDVTSWYWHFMGLLWVYILGLFWFFA